MSVLRRTFYDKFFIPFLTWLSLEIQLLHVKSPMFHVPKEMKFIEMKLERSQIHFIFTLMFAFLVLLQPGVLVKPVS